MLCVISICDKPKRVNGKVETERNGTLKMTDEPEVQKRPKELEEPKEVEEPEWLFRSTLLDEEFVVEKISTQTLKPPKSREGLFDQNNLISNITFSSGSLVFTKRVFGPPNLKRKDKVSFEDVLAFDQSGNIAKEILVEMYNYGEFGGPTTKVNPYGDDVGWGEEYSDDDLSLSEADHFYWEHATYFLHRNGLEEDQWIALYHICHWMQHAFGLYYGEPYEFETNPDMDIENTHWEILIYEKTDPSPVLSGGQLIQPSQAAAILGQYWERYKTHYVYKSLSEYDFGTRGYLDEGRKTAKKTIQRKNRRKDKAIKTIIAKHYPAGIQDVPVSKIAQRIVQFLESENNRRYIALRTKNGTPLAVSTLRNRIAKQKKDGMFD